jgi:hypothetical protein
MASSALQDIDAEPPKKRQRLSSPLSINTASASKQVATSCEMDNTIKQTVVSDSGFQPERDAQVGILHFVNSEKQGFSGTLKQRYVFNTPHLSCVWILQMIALCLAFFVLLIDFLFVDLLLECISS